MLRVKRVVLAILMLMIFAGCSNKAVSDKKTDDVPMTVVEMPVMEKAEAPPKVTELTPLKEEDTPPKEAAAKYEEFSEFEKEIVDFISENYSAIFLDYEMMMVKRLAYVYDLSTDTPPGLGEYVAQEFNVYNAGGHIILIVKLDVPDTSGRIHELFAYIDGEFIKVADGGHTCDLYKDDDGRLILFEQDSFSDAYDANMRLSYITIHDNKLERDVFIDIINNKDEISGVEYESFEWEDIFEWLEKYEPADEFPTEKLMGEIEARSKIENEKYIGWKDLYAEYFMYNSKANSEIAIYNFGVDEIPSLIIDNMVYKIENGAVVLQGEYEGLNELQKYSSMFLKDDFEVIYVYE